jgi:hypothetical protein
MSRLARPVFAWLNRVPRDRQAISAHNSSNLLTQSQNCYRRHNGFE